MTPEEKAKMDTLEKKVEELTSSLEEVKRSEKEKSEKLAKAKDDLFRGDVEKLVAESKVPEDGREKMIKRCVALGSIEEAKSLVDEVSALIPEGAQKETKRAAKVTDNGAGGKDVEDEVNETELTRSRSTIDDFFGGGKK